MIALRKILLPTDFNDTAAVALKYAQAFAEVCGASMHVLHVLEDPLPGWKPEGHVTPVPRIREGMEEDARVQLGKVISMEDRKRLHAELVTKWGNPFVEIVRYAKDHEIDLIVMGTYGRGPIARMLMGSVAEKVVRKAPCPVLTVRQPEHELVMP